MGRALGTMIDRRLSALIVLRLRREWPVLRLVPGVWMLPIVTPGARRVRRVIARGMIVVAAFATAVAVLVALLI